MKIEKEQNGSVIRYFIDGKAEVYYNLKSHTAKGLFVKKAYRQRGLASLLMKEVAREHAIVRATANDISVKACIACGFRVLDTYDTKNFGTAYEVIKNEQNSD